MNKRAAASIVVAIGSTLNIAMQVSAKEVGMKVSSASEQEKSMKASKELAHRGRQLRLDIDRAYKKLSEDGAIKNQGMGRNFITDVVAKYIPVGTSFVEAEEILRSAEFAIQPRVPNQYLPESERYDERAIIDHYVPMPVGKISVSVLLRPRTANDYTVVESVIAEITKTLP